MRDIKKRARTYFRLGEQYTATAALALNALITGGNSNAGLGSTAEEAYAQMIANSSQSDLCLFVPAIFCCLQSTELYAKGLLLLNDIEIDDTHVLAADGLISSPVNPFTGNIISSDYKEENNQQYVILSNLWDVNVNNGYQFLLSPWAAVSGDVTNKENWIYYSDPSYFPSN